MKMINLQNSDLGSYDTLEEILSWKRKPKNKNNIKSRLEVESYIRKLLKLK